MQQEPTGDGAATARARRAHFLIEGETWLYLLPRALVLVLMLLAMLMTSPAPAMEPMELDVATRGIQPEQAGAAARFGAAQADNVNGRLRLLHARHAPCFDRFDIGANIRWERAPPAEGTRPAPTGELNLADVLGRSRCDRPFAAWADGDIDFGFLRPSTATDRSDIRTSGLSLGADTKLRDGVIVGAAIGYGRNDANVDSDGSESRAHGRSLILYGTFESLKAVHIDASIGVGELSFDARRWQATDAEVVSAERGGSQFFGSLGFSADLVAPNVRVAPYARYHFVRSHLDAYGERGSAPAALAHGHIAANEDALTLGIYAGFTLTLGSTAVEPGLRVEQRRVRRGAFDEALTCANDPLVAHMLRQPADSDGKLDAALTVPVRFGAASIAFEYNYSNSSDTLRAESVRARLQTPF
jgi:uncharacterized protein YhjY with autotransporter beta-barrel domain